MTRPWLWVVEALAHREEGSTLAIFRIAVGLTILGELFFTWWTGAADLFWHDLTAGGYRPHLVSKHWVFETLGGATNGTSDLVFAVTTIAVALVIVGLGTNLAAPVALFGLQALFTLSSGAGGGHDRMFTIALFVLTFAQSDATLSAWCRLRTGEWRSTRPVPAWPRVWIAWNLGLIYTSAGIVKLSAEWLPNGNFRAVYNALMTPHWSRGDLAWLWGPLFPLTQVGTAMTVLWESTFLVVPLWLLLRSKPRTGVWARIAAVDVRSIYVAIGIVMHGSLLLFTNLGPFTAITLSWYVVLYSPAEWRALGRRLTSQQPQPSTSTRV